MAAKIIANNDAGNPSNKLFMGFGVVERHLEMAQPTKKKNYDLKVE